MTSDLLGARTYVSKSERKHMSVERKLYAYESKLCTHALMPTLPRSRTRTITGTGKQGTPVEGQGAKREQAVKCTNVRSHWLANLSGCPRVRIGLRCIQPSFHLSGRTSRMCKGRGHSSLPLLPRFHPPIFRVHSSSSLLSPPTSPRSAFASLARCT